MDHLVEGEVIHSGVVVLLVVSPRNKGYAFNFVSLWVDTLEDGGLVVFG